MNQNRFSKLHKIRFSECDPAGIVFYPQYFVMFNNLLESWMDELLVDGFAGYIARQRFGLPTVHLEAEFSAISRMGDDVILELEVIRVGQRSITLRQSCSDGTGEMRMQVVQTYVTTSLETHQAIPIPEEFRRALHLNAPVTDATR